jgi:hypothetical protein
MLRRLWVSAASAPLGLGGRCQQHRTCPAPNNLRLITLLLLKVVLQSTCFLSVNMVVYLDVFFFNTVMNEVVANSQKYLIGKWRYICWIIATNESAAEGNNCFVFFSSGCLRARRRVGGWVGARAPLIVFTTTKIGIRYGGWHPSSVSQGLHDVEFSLQVHVLLFGVKLFALRQLRPHLGGRHVQSRRTVRARTLKQHQSAIICLRIL